MNFYISVSLQQLVILHTHTNITFNHHKQLQSCAPFSERILLRDILRIRICIDVLIELCAKNADSVRKFFVVTKTVLIRVLYAIEI